MHRRCIPIFLTLILASSSSGLAPATQPSPIAYREETRRDPLLRLHIATVDLTDPRVVLRIVRGAPDPDGAGPWQTRLQTVREMAKREKLALAVNGGFFTPKDAMEVLGQRVPYFANNWARASGWTMSDGELWAKEPALASLVVDAKGAVSIGRFGKIPTDARQVVSSFEQVVNRGRNTGASKELAPRTSIGIDRTGKKLTLVVVDGRRADWSAGMTGPQLGDAMIRLGCWDAIMLDGGGSSTMVMFDSIEQEMKLMSHPSDGHDLPIPLSIERPVANAFGVQIRDRSAATKP